MLTFEQVLQSALDKPKSEWSLAECLAAEIMISSGKISRLRKEIKEEEDHYARLVDQWNALS